ncbi:cytochrome P450 [Pisolithus thermaeus]|nr:cytochrome P450 [Pisolithus thermaeus]
MQVLLSTEHATLAAAMVSILCGLLYVMRPPKGLPPGITGPRCLLELPQEKQWLKVQEWSRQYGDIASGYFLGKTTIIIGSVKIAGELLEKRSVNYSDRPRSIMGGELSGWGKIMLLSDYNDWFRTHRKWITQEIGSYDLVKNFNGLIEYETRRFLRCVLDDPEQLRAHVRKNFTSIILRVTYGYKTIEGNDPLVDLAHLANSQLSLSTAPGMYYVDFVHLMKYIPSWLPGADFKRKAEKYAAVVRDLVENPHNWSKNQLAAGTARPSFSARLLSTPDMTTEFEDSVKWASATLYRGGADTAQSVAYGFYLAMTPYPRVSKKVQGELDAVVGTRRLPTFSDRPNLPYMEALFTELLRWHCPGPMTLRHTRNDDTYEGYFIPKGSYVVVNIWAILRDERTYTDPLEFKPERFLGDNPEQDPRNASFGFGRRRCPGYFLGGSSVWLICVQALAVFDISKCIANGVEITPDVDLVGETICHQAQFKCSIKPRSEEALTLLLQYLKKVMHTCYISHTLPVDPVTPYYIPI